MSEAEVNLAAEAVNLGIMHDTHSSKIYEGINDRVEQFQKDLAHTILALKSELTKIKADNPDGKEFDISKHWDAIKEFQELYNKFRLEDGKTETRVFEDTDFERTKECSKALLEQLIEQLSNCSDDVKHKIQFETNKLFTHANLALAMFDALNKVLRSILQSQERRAQQTKVY